MLSIAQNLRTLLLMIELAKFENITSYLEPCATLSSHKKFVLARHCIVHLVGVLFDVGE
jgi:hypothetical protein